MPYAPKAIERNVICFLETTWCYSFYFERMRKASIKKPQLTKMQVCINPTKGIYQSLNTSGKPTNKRPAIELNTNPTQKIQLNFVLNFSAS